MAYRTVLLAYWYVLVRFWSKRTGVPYRTIGVPVRWGAKGREGVPDRTGTYRTRLTAPPLRGGSTLRYGWVRPRAGTSTDESWGGLIFV